jgi:hypothetical protein
MGRACRTTGEKRNAYRILVGKPEGRRPLGRSRSRWVGNTRIDTELLDFRTLSIVENPVILCVIHHRQNPIESIRIDLREIGWDGVDWVDLAQDRDQWRVFVNETSGSIKCWEVLE